MEPCAAAPFAYGAFLSQLLFWLAGSPSQSKSVGFANSLKGNGKPSQSAPAGRVQLPRRGSFGYLPVSTKALPSGELARERLRGFSLLKVGRSFLRSAALSQKAALQMSSPSTTPPVKMGYRNARRRSDIPKFKIIFPLTMPKAQRRAF